MRRLQIALAVALFLYFPLLISYQIGHHRGRATARLEADVAAQWVCAMSDNQAEIAECEASRVRLLGAEED